MTQKLHGDGRPKGPTRKERKAWEATMTAKEVRFIDGEFARIKSEYDFGGCIDNHRASRIWVSSQRRRYFKDRDDGCCGFFDTIVRRWNWRKMHYDKYLIGFNYGH